MRVYYRIAIVETLVNVEATFLLFDYASWYHQHIELQLFSRCSMSISHEPGFSHGLKPKHTQHKRNRFIFGSIYVLCFFSRASSRRLPSIRASIERANCSGQKNKTMKIISNAPYQFAVWIVVIDLLGMVSRAYCAFLRNRLLTIDFHF